MSPSILPFHFTALLLLPLQLLLATATNFSFSKPGCPSQCGNLTVPYPFGIGSSCSLNTGYALNCDTSADPPKTFIQTPLTNFEVLSISLSASQVRIRNNISFQCFNPEGQLVSNQSRVTMILGITHVDSPYTFSATANKFVVIGCDVFGVFTAIEKGNSCGSYCSKKEDVVGGYCSTNGCCQTPIPKGLKWIGFSSVFTDDRVNVTKFDPCANVFIGEEEQFVFQGLSDFEPSFANRVIENVPIVLDWVIGNETCSQGQQNLGSYVCQHNTVCIDADNTTGGYLCRCLPGYEGNPYLSPGCTDIDECVEKSSHQCSKTCTNTRGSYKCSCPPGFAGDGYRNATGCFVNPSLRGLKVGLGTSLGALLLLIGVSWTYILIRKRKLMKLKEHFFKQNGGLLLRKELSSVNNEGGIESSHIYTIEELKMATKNFSEVNILGRGGYGTVYKGLLPNNRTVAIKKSKTVDQSQIEQFINEVVILSGINHRNVVKLLGCCLETEVPLLVYEFVSNGTLFEHIHNESGLSWLSWSNCLRIAVEAAEALAYLHSASSTPVIHRDIKSTNILIDDNYAAKISDFGASRLVPLDYTQINTIVQGTLGYLDPEYFLTSQLTEKSDVFSFGVVLAELLTRQKPFSPEKAKMTDKSLAASFVMSIREGRFYEIIDPQLLKEAPVEQLTIVAELVGQCLSGKGDDRPTMKDVATELERLRKQITIHPWEYQQDESTNLLSDPRQGDLYPVPSHDQIHTASSSGLDSLQKDTMYEMSFPR